MSISNANAVAILETYKLNNTQDKAAMKQFISIIVQFQKFYGLEDDKLRRYLSAVADMMEID